MSTTCRSCGSQLTSSDRYCSTCGTQANDGEHCLSCGAPHRPDDVYCGSCGSELLGFHSDDDDGEIGHAISEQRRRPAWLGLALLVVVVLVGGTLAILNLGVSDSDANTEGAASEQPIDGLPEWAPYDGLAAFCDRYEEYWTRYDQPLRAAGDVSEAQAFSEMVGLISDIRITWRNLGFPDEVVGAARSVDAQFDILDDFDEGDLEAFRQLEDDPEVAGPMNAGNAGYEEIREYVRSVCI